MNKLAIQDVARSIVMNIVSDLSDRRGLGQEWDQIDDDIREDIETVWRTIVGESIAEAVQRKESE